MLALAERRCAGLAQIDLKQAGVEDLPEECESFDAAACVQVLLYADVPTALSEIKRVLKRGGRIAILETDWRGTVLNSFDEALTRKVLAAEMPRPERKQSAQQFPRFAAAYVLLGRMGPSGGRDYLPLTIGSKGEKWRREGNWGRTFSEAYTLHLSTRLSPRVTITAISSRASPGVVDPRLNLGIGVEDQRWTTMPQKLARAGRP